MIDPFMMTLWGLAIGGGSVWAARSTLKRMGLSGSHSKSAKPANPATPKNLKSWPKRGPLRLNDTTAEYFVSSEGWGFARRVRGIILNARLDLPRTGLWLNPQIPTAEPITAILAEGRQVEFYFSLHDWPDEVKTPDDFAKWFSPLLAKWMREPASAKSGKDFIFLWRALLTYPIRVHQFATSLGWLSTLILLLALHTSLHLIPLNSFWVVTSGLLPVALARAASRRAPTEMPKFVAAFLAVPLGLALALWLNIKWDSSDKVLKTLPIERVEAGFVTTNNQPLRAVHVRWQGHPLRLELKNPEDLSRINPEQTQVQLLIRKGALGLPWLESWLFIWQGR